MSQFFFKMKHKDKEIEVSFNIDKITTTELLGDGRCIVKLDDWREEMRDFEQSSKNGKGTIRVARKVPVSTELVLPPEDAKRFKAITDISSWEWEGEKSAEEIHKEEIEKFIKEEVREEVKEELQEEETKEEDFKVE